MQWRDRGIVLRVRRQGEHSAIVRILSRQHGAYGGWVHALSRQNGTYQPGNRVTAVWRSRLSENLGSFRCELEDSPTARILHRSERLAGLMSCCSLAEVCFAERAPDPRAYDDFDALLQALEGDRWAPACVRWEVALLSRMGFGLDLESCAVRGSPDIAYVSPKSGRGVSAAAAEPWRTKLLPLPPFLRPHADPQAPVSNADIACGLRLCGFFLERHLQAHVGQKLPAARRCLAETFQEGAAPPPGFAGREKRDSQGGAAPLKTPARGL